MDELPFKWGNSQNYLVKTTPGGIADQGIQDFGL
jgi:hypothetical protein